MSRFSKASVLLLSLFGLIHVSDNQMLASSSGWPEWNEYFKQRNKESYRHYFEQQKLIYKDLSDLGIPGVCMLRVDEDLAEQVLANSQQNVCDLVANIQGKRFDREMYLLQGDVGTGKTAAAQAVAIKTQIPCLFFDTSQIVLDNMKTGEQYLEKIFEYAQKLHKITGRPCIMIFDKLEAVFRKDDTNNDKNHKLLLGFLDKLDYLNNRLSDVYGARVALVGVMDESKRLPDQILGKIRMIEISLPNQEQRKSIFTYYLKDLNDKYGIVHSYGVSPVVLARNTKGYSHRDVKCLVEQAAGPLIVGGDLSNKSNKLLTHQACFRLIKKAKREARSQFIHNAYQRYFRMPKNPVAFGAIMLGCMTIFNQKRQMDQTKEIAEKQLEQAQEIAEKQMNLTDKGLVQSKEIAEAQRKQAVMIAAVQSMVQLLTFGLFHFPKS